MKGGEDDVYLGRNVSRSLLESSFRHGNTTALSPKAFVHPVRLNVTNSHG
jgi:hypothetical protein